MNGCLNVVKFKYSANNFRFEHSLCNLKTISLIYFFCVHLPTKITDSC